MVALPEPRLALEKSGKVRVRVETCSTSPSAGSTVNLKVEGVGSPPSMENSKVRSAEFWASNSSSMMR